jgi:hypothetical protein
MTLTRSIISTHIPLLVFIPLSLSFGCVSFPSLHRVMISSSLSLYLFTCLLCFVFHSLSLPIHFFIYNFMSLFSFLLFLYLFHMSLSLSILSCSSIYQFSASPSLYSFLKHSGNYMYHLLSYSVTLNVTCIVMGFVRLSQEAVIISLTT